MESVILERGQGFLGKVTVNSVYGYEAFKSKKNKRLYIKILKEEAGADVCLVAYCVTDDAAHVIAKGITGEDVSNYISRANSIYEREYDCGKISKGYPFRPEMDLKRLRSEELNDAIAYVHSMAPVAPNCYDYNSFKYLYEGRSGGTAVILAENGGDLTREEFISAINYGSVRAYGEKAQGKEKFGPVLKDLKMRYLDRPGLEEKTVVFVLASLCDRCGIGYEKAAKALGFKKGDRRDVMISTLCDMMLRRGHNFGESVDIMQLYKEDRNELLMACIVEINRVYQYSYDHIISAFGVRDLYYDIVVEIFCNLHRKYNYNFEELCLKFHLQNDIISIRQRCGF